MNSFHLYILQVLSSLWYSTCLGKLWEQYCLPVNNKETEKNNLCQTPGGLHMFGVYNCHADMFVVCLIFFMDTSVTAYQGSHSDHKYLFIAFINT